MPWGRVDDNLAFHPKVLQAGNLAMGLWVRALSWCSQQLNDGRVPINMIAALAATQDDADALVRAGLWHETIDGYEFHDWHDRQPTRESVLTKRAETAERVAGWRASKRETSNAVSNAVTTALVTQGVTLPHTHTHTPKRESAPKRASSSAKGTRLPADFAVDEQLLQYTIENAPSLDVAKELENFRDYWDAVAGAKGVKLDWRATWRTWVRRGHERNVAAGWKSASSTTKDTSTKLTSWLAARGVSMTEYEANKTKTGWLESLKEIS